MPRSFHPHTLAVLQALLVTFLWSTSFVLVKFGLDDIQPLTFAGLRYFTAFICLLPVALQPARRPEFAILTRQDWRNLAILGVIFYSITQGAQFFSLKYLPAATVSLMLNCSAIVIIAMGVFFLQEYPSRLQLFGTAIFFIGVLVYFYPVSLPRTEMIGLGIALIQVFTTSIGAVMGRFINRANRLPALVVTTVSMGIGSALMLVVALLSEGLPALSMQNIMLILWLAVVNTAFAFTLWNHVLRSLSATEASIINNTMLIQIALLAWLFLGEDLSAQKIAGMLLVAAGIWRVQWR